MIYEFSSRATAPFVMMKPHAVEVLRILGKADEPQGIIENRDIPLAVDRLKGAVAMEQAALAHASLERAPDDEPEEESVTLQQRVWPLVEMLERSHRSGLPVTWMRRPE